MAEIVDVFGVGLPADQVAQALLEYAERQIQLDRRRRRGDGPAFSSTRWIEAARRCREWSGFSEAGTILAANLDQIELLTCADLAREWATTPRTITNWARKGLIESARRVGSQWVIVHVKGLPPRVSNYERNRP